MPNDLLKTTGDKWVPQQRRMPSQAGHSLDEPASALDPVLVGIGLAVMQQLAE